MKFKFVTAIAVVLVSTGVFAGQGLGKLLKKEPKNEPAKTEEKAVEGDKPASTDHNPLPFKIKIGGQSATAKPGYLYATVEKPVAADAVIEVGLDNPDMIIVSVHACEKNEEVKDGLKPGKLVSTILLEKKNKAQLDQGMDKKKLAPGTYYLGVVGGDNTAMVIIKVK
jgi:hypothetical protein